MDQQNIEQAEGYLVKAIPMWLRLFWVVVIMAPGTLMLAILTAAAFSREGALFIQTLVAILFVAIMLFLLPGWGALTIWEKRFKRVYDTHRVTAFWGDVRSKVRNTLIGGAIFTALAALIARNNWPQLWWLPILTASLAGLYIARFFIFDTDRVLTKAALMAKSVEPAGFGREKTLVGNFLRNALEIVVRPMELALSFLLSLFGVAVYGAMKVAALILLTLIFLGLVYAGIHMLAALPVSVAIVVGAVIIANAIRR